MRPLDGVRVADFTNHAAGPYCAMLLGLLGAEVIRIESNTRLDIQRRSHPVYGRMEVPSLDYLGTHKKSITLNLKKAEARELAIELVRVSDVVVENFRPGVMQRLGLDWPVLNAANPRVVMLSLSAYGQTGPDGARPGYAPIFAAEGGLGYLTGYPDGPPGEIRNLMDHQAGLTAAFAVLALLESRDATGVGTYADLAAREVATMMVGESVVQALRQGHATRVGNTHEVWVPHGVYPARGDDRWIALAIRSDEEWLRLVHLMGEPEWCDSELASGHARRDRRDEIDAGVAAWSSRHDDVQLVEMLQGAGLSANRSMRAADLLEDEHLLKRETITQLTHPVHGRRMTVGAPWHFKNADVRFREWSKSLGADNEEVICGLLGVSASQYAEWLRDEVIY